MKNLSIVLLTVWSVWGIAVEVPAPIDIPSKFKLQLNTLKELGPQKYINEVPEIKKGIEKIFAYKKRSCQGEFISTIWTEQGEREVAEKKRLTREERKLCLQEMRGYRVEFINSLYEARKKFLNYSHQQRLDSLKLAQEETIKRLGNRTLKRKK